MESKEILGLFKFGERSHLEQFVAGQIYMNSLSYFVGIENDLARSDPHEGERFWLQSSQIVLSVQINNEYKPINGLTGLLRFSHPDDLNANLFCMHAVGASPDMPVVDERNFEFGNTYAAILSGDEFLRRVAAAAVRTGLQLKWNLVDYVDDSSYQGNMGIFRKSSMYSYQREFRIALLSGPGGPITLEVGDLSDIVVLGPLERLNQDLRVC